MSHTINQLSILFLVFNSAALGADVDFLLLVEKDQPVQTSLVQSFANGIAAHQNESIEIEWR